uniref:Uncharacterized protein n=1 Tax=Ditylenchus dipsaci TaxID=166011 RepID=A0A915CL21_9BILA
MIIKLKSRQCLPPRTEIIEHNNPVVSVKCRILPPPQNGKCVEGMCMTAQFIVAGVEACLDNPDGGCVASSVIYILFDDQFDQFNLQERLWKEYARTSTAFPSMANAIG